MTRTGALTYPDGDAAAITWIAVDPTASAESVEGDAFALYRRLLWRDADAGREPARISASVRIRDATDRRRAATAELTAAVRLGLEAAAADYDLVRLKIAAYWAEVERNDRERKREHARRWAWGSRETEADRQAWRADDWKDAWR